MLDTNLRGAVAEQAVIFNAIRLGIPVWLPATEHGRIDMVLEVGGRLWKVQCKSGHVSRDGDVVIVRLVTCRRGPAGYIHTTYSADEIDFIAAYCDELDRCFLLPASLTEGMSAIQLRLTPPRNGQRACINLAEDFDFVGAIAQLGERLRGTQEVAGSSPASSTTRPTASSASEVTAVASNPFRDRLGYWMERVASGEEILVTYRGKPRIRVAPLSASARPP
jgi:hypothetical protein